MTNLHWQFEAALIGPDNARANMSGDLGSVADKATPMEATHKMVAVLSATFGRDWLVTEWRVFSEVQPKTGPF